VNDEGKKAKDKRTGKLSTLEAWEGYRVFRDERSPTGWIDLHRIPIVAIDTNGHALRQNLRTGKVVYVDATPAGDDGFLGKLSKGLTIFGGDIFGGILDAAGLDDLQEMRVQAGLAATAAIVGAGGIGEDTAAGMFGSGTASIGGEGQGGGGMVNLSSILSTEGTDGLPSWLQGIGGIVEQGLDIYGQVQGALNDDEPAPSSSGGGYRPTMPAASGAPSWVMPAVLIGGAVLLFLLVRKK
jgi:hypothetical protein